MAKKNAAPSLLWDIGTLAEVYRTVFWLMAQRLRHGRNWQRFVKNGAPFRMRLPDPAEAPALTTSTGAPQRPRRRVATGV